MVFPVQGRRWAFGLAASATHAGGTPRADLTLRQVWANVCENALQGKSLVQSFGPLTHYLSDKMEQKWLGLREAPEGSMRNRMHSMGEKLLAQIKPSEAFLKSMPKDSASLEITFPSSLNPRLVRRRVRHIAMSGAQVHARYMYGSFALLPFTILFGIVPVPNAPLFWNLFRAYANWQALQGSRKLLQFVNDDSSSVQSKVKSSEDKDSLPSKSCQQTLVLSPCKTLESMVHPEQDRTQALSDSSMAAICQHYHLDYSQMLKWRNFVDKKA